MTESRDLIIYLEDNGSVITCYSDSIEMENGYVKFKTKENTMIIPLHRVLKIKKAKDEVNEYE